MSSASTSTTIMKNAIKYCQNSLFHVVQSYIKQRYRISDAMNMFTYIFLTLAFECEFWTTWEHRRRLWYFFFSRFIYDIHAICECQLEASGFSYFMDTFRLSSIPFDGSKYHKKGRWGDIERQRLGLPMLIQILKLNGTCRQSSLAE